DPDPVDLGHLGGPELVLVEAADVVLEVGVAAGDAGADVTAVAAGLRREPRVLEHVEAAVLPLDRDTEPLPLLHDAAGDGRGAAGEPVARLLHRVLVVLDLSQRAVVGVEAPARRPGLAALGLDDDHAVGRLATVHRGRRR